MFDWLRDYQQLMQRIRYIEFKIEQSENEKRRWETGGLQYTHLTKGSNAEGLINGDYIERDKMLLDELISHRKVLLRFIDTFEDLDSRILKMKYIEGKSLREIADELRYSYSHIKQCHSKLVKVMQIFDKHLLDYFDDNDDN